LNLRGGVLVALYEPWNAVASEPSRRRRSRRRRRRRRKKKKCFATPAVAATTFMRGAV